MKLTADQLQGKDQALKFSFILLLHYSICIFLIYFSDEFKNYALTHPVYAKLFTTYLELQRYHSGMLDEDGIESNDSPVKDSPVTKSAIPVSETTPIARNKVCPEGNDEDNSSTSDKKDD